MAPAFRPDSACVALAGLSARREKLADWRRRLTIELIELPETLKTLREGAANFELVARRLSNSSDALEQMTELYKATLADSARQSADAARALRSQIDALSAAGSPDRVMSALGEMQRAMESMAKLNPLWPISGGRAERAD